MKHTAMLVAAALIPAAAQAQWKYSAHKDEMRNQVTKSATLASTNSVNFRPPYSGGSRLHVVLSYNDSRGTQVMLWIDRGQFLCGYDYCRWAMKFDDEQMSYRLVPSRDGDSSALFVDNESAFIEELLKAKRLIIEADFYTEGTKQFTFRIGTVNWPPK